MDLNHIVDYMARCGVNIDEGQAEQFDVYFRMLVDWNTRVNLTAITEPEEVLVKHFADSVALGRLPGFAPEGKQLLDMGTGAGFPAIPLKIAYPGLQVTMLDSLNKRIRFLDAVIEELHLTGIRAVHGRAEDFAGKAEYRESFDLAVSRAVANMAVLAEYCLPYVKMGGCFVAYKAAEYRDSGEKDASLKAIKILGGELKNVLEYTLPGSDAYRCLAVVEKTAATPKKYPRRAGLPAKEPL